MLRSLKDNVYGVIDLGIVLMIGIAFAGLKFYVADKNVMFGCPDGDSLYHMDCKRYFDHTYLNNCPE